ncbi:MAG: hypothetical protein ACJ74Q_15950 [Pyrinomonadaceae bacterium]
MNISANKDTPAGIKSYARQITLSLLLSLGAFACPAAYAQESAAEKHDGGLVSVVVRFLDLNKSDVDGARAPRRTSRRPQPRLADAASVYDRAFFESRFAKLNGRGKAHVERTLTALVKGGERLHLGNGDSYLAARPLLVKGRFDPTPRLINEDSSVELLVRPDAQTPGDYEVVFEAMRVTITTTPPRPAGLPAQAIKYFTARNFFLRAGQVALLRDGSASPTRGRARGHGARYIAITVTPATTQDTAAGPVHAVRSTGR